MSYASVDFYVNDTSPLANPVAGVTVKILSTDGTLVYGMSVTDATGHAGFLLPDSQQYQSRFYLFGASFTQPLLFSVLPEPLAPGQTNTFSVPATLITPPIPTDARLCTAFGFFRDVTGAPQSCVQIHLIAQFDPVWLDGAAVVSERVVVTSDPTGYVQVNLIRNGQYECTVQGEEDVVRIIHVPDAPNINIADLIFPVIQQLTTTPAGPFTVNVGQQLTVNVNFTSSDGQSLGIAQGDVMWSTSDGTILGYTFSPPTGLVLIGIAPGTAQIIATRADQSIVRIPDPGILGSPISVTVTS